MINLDMIFHVMVSVYRLLKIWNLPQFPAEFRNGLYVQCYFEQNVLFLVKLTLEFWSLLLQEAKKMLKKSDLLNSFLDHRNTLP